MESDLSNLALYCLSLSRKKDNRLISVKFEVIEIIEFIFFQMLDTREWTAEEKECQSHRIS